MNGIERCPICNYHESVPSLESSMGSVGVCFECIEHRAELPITIHGQARSAYRMKESSTVRKAIIKHLKGVTCWAGPELGYMPLAAYEARISRQMPVVRTEDDLIAERLAKKLQEIRKGMEERREVKRSKFQAFMDGVRAIFRPLTEAIEAGV